MPSIVWGRHPQEAYDNPYEYAAQEQFLRESKKLLSDIGAYLDRYTLRYHRDECSLDKATWLLCLDLVATLSECADLLEQRRHRPAARLFRDAVETIDLLKVLHSESPRAITALAKWYTNETIPHREARAHLQEVEGPEAAKQRKVFYDDLSKLTHRTYRALLHSCSLGRDDLLVHDSHGSGHLVLPHTIASYLAVLADIIIQATDCLAHTGVVPPKEMQSALESALDTHTVPRRFVIVRPPGEP